MRNSFHRPIVFTELLEPRKLLSTTFYVDASCPGPAHTGSSWSTAYTDLQLALAAANPGDSIHVANGTYTPNPGGGDRTATFLLKNNVSLFGGYAGDGAPNPDLRDPATYVSILSGNLAAPYSNLDNSYHVVTGSGTDSTAVLDGFTISAGNANASFPNTVGAGLYLNTGTPVISNCTFSSNSAVSGAAVYCDSASPTFNSCFFTSNSASSSGGAVTDTVPTTSSPPSAPLFTDCSFTANSAGTGGGGAFYEYIASSTFIRCSFTRNSSTGSGGAFYEFHAPSLFLSSAFNANQGTFGGAIYADYFSNLTLGSCTFVANTATSSSSAIYFDYYCTPTVADSTFVSNISPNGDILHSDYHSAVSLVNSILFSNTGASLSTSNNGTFSASHTDSQSPLVGTGNISADPVFYRNPSSGPDNISGTADDDYGDLHLLPGSPAIDAGSNAAVPAGVTADLAGSPRIVDFPGTGLANSAVVDMGAYEASSNLGALHVIAGQTVTLPAGGYNFSATQLTIDAGGTLDLSNDSLLLDYTGTSPLPSLRQSLHDHLLTSSTAAATPNHSLGYGEAADLGLTTFAGQPVDSTALLLKYTLTGDANLDGRINADDFAFADRGQAKHLSTWTAGDFNYDGFVTDADLHLLNTTYASLQSPALAAPAAVSIVTPTPTQAPVTPTTATVPSPSHKPAPIVEPTKVQKKKSKKSPKSAPGPAVKPVPIASKSEKLLLSLRTFFVLFFHPKA